MSVHTTKDRRLELRLSVQEREVISEKAKGLGMSLSDFVRMSALTWGGGIASESRSGTAIARKGATGPSSASSGDTKGHPVKDSDLRADAPSSRYHCPNGCDHEAGSLIRCRFCRTWMVPLP